MPCVTEWVYATTRIKRERDTDNTHTRAHTQLVTLNLFFFKQKQNKRRLALVVYVIVKKKKKGRCALVGSSSTTELKEQLPLGFLLDDGSAVCPPPPLLPLSLVNKEGIEEE